MGHAEVGLLLRSTRSLTRSPNFTSTAFLLGRVSFGLDPLTLQAPKRWNLLASPVDSAGNLPNSSLSPRMLPEQATRKGAQRVITYGRVPCQMACGSNLTFKKVSSNFIASLHLHPRVPSPSSSPPSSRRDPFGNRPAPRDPRPLSFCMRPSSSLQSLSVSHAVPSNPASDQSHSPGPHLASHQRP